MVNVKWTEKEFNAGQTHSSIYPSIFNRLRAIVRYWSEIATFSYPLAFNAPVGGVPIGIPGKSLVLRKLESWGSGDSLMTGWAILTQYHRVTDRRPAYTNNVRSNIDARQKWPLKWCVVCVCVSVGRSLIKISKYKLQFYHSTTFIISTQKSILAYHFNSGLADHFSPSHRKIRDMSCLPFSNEKNFINSRNHIVSDMTYNVFGATLNPTLLLLLVYYYYSRNYIQLNDANCRLLKLQSFSTLGIPCLRT